MSRLSDVRLYVVTSTDSGTERLVRAPNKSRAVRLSCSARIASQEDLERLFAAGVKAETPAPVVATKPAVPRRRKPRARR